MIKVYYCVTGGCGNAVGGPGGMCRRCSDELAALRRRHNEKRDKAATKQAKRGKK